MFAGGVEPRLPKGPALRPLVFVTNLMFSLSQLFATVLDQLGNRTPEQESYGCPGRDALLARNPLLTTKRPRNRLRGPWDSSTLGSHTLPRKRPNYRNPSHRP